MTDLLWLDLETTGLDVEGKEYKDEIIEVAVKLTDENYVPLWQFQSVIKPGWTELSKIIGRIITTPAVRKMHTANGLVDALLAGEGDFLKNVEDHIVVNLAKYGRSSKPMLAGSGVGHFDIRFLRRDMQRLMLCLAHPIYDVGVVRRFVQNAGIAVPEFRFGNEASQHRAAVDVDWHIAEAKWYRKNLFLPYRENVQEAFGEEGFDEGS